MTKEELANWIHDQLELAESEGDLDIEDLDIDGESVIVVSQGETFTISVGSDLDE